MPPSSRCGKCKSLHDTVARTICEAVPFTGYSGHGPCKLFRVPDNGCSTFAQRTFGAHFGRCSLSLFPDGCFDSHRQSFKSAFSSRFFDRSFLWRTGVSRRISGCLPAGDGLKQRSTRIACSPSSSIPPSPNAGETARIVLTRPSSFSLGWKFNTSPNPVNSLPTPPDPA